MPKVSPYIIPILLLFFYGLFLVHPLNLATADLGRHIKNGELLFTGEFEVLDKNFYSYTEPDSPTINHHWLSGIVFYLLWKEGGFKLVHFFFILLSLAAFLLFFYIAQKESSPSITFLSALLLIPIIAERAEIRPEVFSYFFAGVFFLILWKYRRQEFSPKFLWLLPIFQILWVNLHSYFIVGPLLILLFAVEAILQKKSARHLFILFLLTLLATLANPFGFKGALVPFTIFRNYGYPLVENQSVKFLENYGIQNPNFIIFKIAAFVLILAFLTMLFRSRRNFHLIYFGLGAVLAVAAALALRNFTLFGFFALPILSYQTGKIFENIKINKIALFFAALFLGGLILTTHRRYLWERNFGIGVLPESQKAAEFFIRENLKGPIFNNYDIGGYLIFNLFPKERVFVDNRPETYSVDFFEKTYIPMQNDEVLWENLLKKYGFNVIFFTRNDITPWAQKFLAERVKDPKFKLVYIDDFAIIFLRSF